MLGLLTIVATALPAAQAVQRMPPTGLYLNVANGHQMLYDNQTGAVTGASVTAHGNPTIIADPVTSRWEQADQYSHVCVPHPR